MKFKIYARKTKSSFVGSEYGEILSFFTSELAPDTHKAFYFEPTKDHRLYVKFMDLEDAKAYVSL